MRIAWTELSSRNANNPEDAGNIHQHDWMNDVQTTLSQMIGMTPGWSFTITTLQYKVQFGVGWGKQYGEGCLSAVPGISLPSDCWEMIPGDDYP